ncbi:MAG: YraN family protein [Myxococcales bacterium]|nr:YraN family protein [Myxococcales bacterium]
MPADGPSTHERGRRGEQIAVDLLRQSGYRIVERNYRWAGGEIDIIAAEGDTLCFVEVRTRQDDERGDPLETVSAHKQRQIVRAARLYLADHDVGDSYVRFDVVGIVYEPEPRAVLIRGAFDAPSNW